MRGSIRSWHSRETSHLVNIAGIELLVLSTNGRILMSAINPPKSENTKTVQNSVLVSPEPRMSRA
jgi:hypothetical protein